MNEKIKQFANTAGAIPIHGKPKDRALVGMDNIEKFTKMIVEETLKQVDERTYCRGETSWYNDDKDWVRLHFGYGKFVK